VEIRRGRGPGILAGQGPVELAGQHHRRPDDAAAVEGGGPGGHGLVQVAESGGGEGEDQERSGIVGRLVPGGPGLRAVGRVDDLLGHLRGLGVPACQQQ
jgi:hypothetical protein